MQAKVLDKDSRKDYNYAYSFSMAERDDPRYYERFDILQHAQEALERAGYVFLPIPREHTEGRVTGPLLHRLRTHITKRSFARIAGHVAITFSGYGEDPREIYEIPEIRGFWRTLDGQLPELPALLTVLPAFGYNGPGQHLSLLGTIDAVVPYPAERRYHLHIAEGPALIANAVTRIRQAGRKYHLPEPSVGQLVDSFRHHAGAP